MATSNKLEYLNETKNLIKNKINFLGGELTNNNSFREYANALDTIWEEYPKVNEDGTDLILNNVKQGGMRISFQGKCSQFNTTGKNLFPGWEEGSINTTTGEPYDYSNRYRSKAYIEIQQNTNYYFSIERITSTAFWFIIFKYDENKNYLGYQYLKEDDGYIYQNTINISDNDTKYIKISEIAPATAFSNTQLELGTSRTSYEPYTGRMAAPSSSYPFPVKVVTGENSLAIQNKNLIVGDINIVKSKNTDGEWNDNSYSYRGITFTYNNDKSITIKGTSTGAVNFQISDDYPLNSNTDYTLLNQNGLTPSGLQIQNFYINLGVGYQPGTLQPNNQIRRFTTGEVTGLNMTKLIVGRDTTIDTTVYPMLVKGSVITDIPDYIVSQSQVYPISLGNMEFCASSDGAVRDYIYGSPNNWYKREYIRKYTFTGQEGFGVHTTTETYLRLYTTGTEFENLVNGGLSYCNYFSNDNTPGGISVINAFRIALGGSGANIRTQFWICLDINDFEDLTDFTNWLTTKYNNNTPVITYNPLATPVDVPITDNTLISQLNNIYNNARSYNNITNITTAHINNNEQIYLDIKALKKDS